MTSNHAMTSNHKWTAVLLPWILLSAPAIADLQSPPRVQASLRQFAHDLQDMQRKLNAQAYERIPHEHEDFLRDAASLRVAIAGESADFRRSAEIALNETLEASSHVAQVSDTRDAGQVRLALDGLADAIRRLNALFPESLRSE